MVKARISEIEVFDGAISLNVDAWVNEVARVIRARSFGQGATPSVQWALSL